MAILSRSQPRTRRASGPAGIDQRHPLATGLLYAAGLPEASIGESDGSPYFDRTNSLLANLAQPIGTPHGYYLANIPSRVSEPYGMALSFNGNADYFSASKAYTRSFTGTANGAAADESCLIVCTPRSSTGSQLLMGYAHVWSSSLADYGRGIGFEGGNLMAWGTSAQNGKKLTAAMPTLNRPVVIAARFGVSGFLMVDGRVVAAGDMSHSWSYRFALGCGVAATDDLALAPYNGSMGARFWWRRGLTEGELAELSRNPHALFRDRRRRSFVVSSGTSPVTIDLSATYAVQSIATSDSAATYAIRAAVSADLGASFAIRTAAQADAAASFVVRGSASADAAASFAIRGAVSADSSAAYAVRTSAAADLAAAFVVGSVAVTLDLPAGYAIRTSATADAAGSYAIRTTSTSDASASYSIRTTASADASAAYTVRASAQADAASTFAIRTSASADLAGAFAIINAGVVVADFASSYNVRGTAQADASAAFAIRTAAQADRAAAFVVRGAAQADMVGAYDIINALAVSADLVASWKITGTVARDLFAAYAVGEVLAEASPGFTAAPGVGAPLVARFAPPTFRGN